MLVLSRRLKEEVFFPDLQVSVQVLEIKGDRVRLGFSAPASVTIVRGELAHESIAASPAAKRPPLVERTAEKSRRSSIAARRVARAPGRVRRLARALDLVGQ